MGHAENKRHGPSDPSKQNTHAGDDKRCCAPEQALQPSSRDYRIPRMSLTSLNTLITQITPVALITPENPNEPE